MQTHSLSQAAALMGVHRNTLAQWLREGCPAVEKADRERGVEWQLALPDVIEWRIERAVANVAAVTGDGTVIQKDEADRRRSVALAHMAEIDLEERLKSLVSREAFLSDVSTFCLTLKTAIASAFAKMAVRCASMTEPAEIDGMCRKEWNRAMTLAREELNRNWKRRLDGDAMADPLTE